MSLAYMYRPRTNPGLAALVGPELTHTNATDATVRDLYNVLRTVPASSGEGRFTGQRYVRNLITYSEDFSNAVWGASNLSVDTNTSATTDPNGGNTADLVYPTTTGTYRRFLYNISSISVDGKTVTASIYVKSAGFTWLYFGGPEAASSADDCYFNVVTGTAGTVGANIDAYSITDVGEGWFRISVSQDIVAGSSEYIYIMPVDSDNQTTATTSGTDGVYLWGAQLEDVTGQPDPAPSEYIATTTAAKGEWYGTRRRTNLLTQSQELDGSHWTSNTVTVASGVEDKDGGSLGYTLTSTGANQVLQHDNITVPVSALYTGSIWIKRRTGSGNIDLMTPGANSWETQSVSGTWQRFDVEENSNSTTGYFRLRIVTSGDEVDVCFPQFEQGSEATDYIATTDSIASSDFDATAGLYTESENLCLYSEDFSNAAWTGPSTATLTQGVTDKDGGTTAVTVTATAGNQTFRQDAINTIGDHIVYSCWIKRRTGTGAIELYTDTYTDVSDQLVTGQWVRTWAGGIAAVAHFLLRIATSGDEIDVCFCQAENVTAAFHKGPSSYIATTTAAVTAGRWEPAPGLLVEEARTNVCKQSENLSTTWIASNSTVTADQGVFANGLAVMDDVVHTTTAGAMIQSAITVTADTIYTFSGFARQGNTGSHDWCYLWLRESGTANGYRAWFNISTGAKGNLAAVGAGASNGDYEIEDWGGGLYRVSISCQLPSAVTAAEVIMSNVTGNNSATAETTDSVCWGGMQLEAGAFPTSYIKTTSASVTRNADIVKTNDVTWINETEGSFFAEAITSQAPDDVAFTVLEVSDPTVGQRLILQKNTAINAKWTVIDVTTQAGINIQPSWLSGISALQAVAYKENDFAFYFNGVSGPADTVGTVPSGFDEFALCDFQGLNQINGHIGEIRYYNERMDDATLLAMSSRGVFPVKSDGGHLFPIRSWDRRVSEYLITQGVTATPDANFDFRLALATELSISAADALNISIDDMWKRWKDANSVTDTAEPFTFPPI